MSSKSEKKHDKSTKNRNSKETEKNKKDIKNDEQNKKTKKKGFWKRHRKLAIFIKLIFVLIILACIVGAGAIVALFSNDDWAMSKDDLTLKIIDTIIWINNKENKFLVQDLKNQEVEFKQFDNIAKGAINTKTFIKIYLKE